MNKVVHFEIPFDNKARAMKFYAETFGWQLLDMPQMSYVMATTAEVDKNMRPKEPGAINGGLFQRPQDAPHPTIYLGVNSVDDAIRGAVSAGGRVVTPNTAIPGMGAYARVADTEGNVIGLFESVAPPPTKRARPARRSARRPAKPAKRAKPRRIARGRRTRR